MLPILARFLDTIISIRRFTLKLFVRFQGGGVSRKRWPAYPYSNIWDYKHLIHSEPPAHFAEVLRDIGAKLTGRTIQEKHIMPVIED